MFFTAARAIRRVAPVLLISLIAWAGNGYAATIAWTAVGNAGNIADDTGFGAVTYAYNIGTYEVTNAQYVEFLNAKDPTGVNSLGLYDGSMSSINGGINLSAANPAGSKYSSKPGSDNRPVNFVTWYDAIRFVNWLNNSQGDGDTESGAYTLLGGAPIPINGPSIRRNPAAMVFLPSEDEWYKAAYYHSPSASYFDYPTGSNTKPLRELPPGGVNSANYAALLNRFTDVGAYVDSTSPYGTFDQTGNAEEWIEAPIVGGSFRGLRDGSIFLDLLHASQRDSFQAAGDGVTVGFRVASIPEPATALLAAMAFAVTGWWRMQRRRP